MSKGVSDQANLDQLLTLKQAAETLGQPYFKVQRAARSGLIATYSIFNSRKYVTMRDILKAMSVPDKIS